MIGKTIIEQAAELLGGDENVKQHIQEAFRESCQHQAAELRGLLDDWLRDPKFESEAVVNMAAKAHSMCASLFVVVPAAGPAAQQRADQYRAEKVREIVTDILGEEGQKLH